MIRILLNYLDTRPGVNFHFFVIQIFGTKKCFETKKAQRFFKEHRTPVQFINLGEKAMSKGELGSVRRSVPLEELIDTECKEYEKLNLKYIQHDIEEKLLEHPLLFKTPVVRNGKEAAVGYQAEVWKKWIGK